jgi:hypothetical protein
MKVGSMGAAILIAALLGAIGLGLGLLLQKQINFTTLLPLLLIAGIVVLLLILTFVVLLFASFGLADKTQALGLPDGSIRSVISLALIVLFVILAVFIYNTESTPYPSTLEHVTNSERWDFIKMHPTIVNIEAKLETGPTAGAQPDGGGSTYTLSYAFPTPPEANDFGKQLLVLLGTLMTAVVSFYLGTKSPTTQLPETEGLSTRRFLRINEIDPQKYSLASGGQLLLRLQGSNLNEIVVCKLRKGTDVVQATEVVSNPSLVIAGFQGKPALAAGTWDIVLEDRNGVATQGGALEVTS